MNWRLAIIRIMSVCIILESLASIIYHNDPNPLSIVSLGRYARIVASIIILVVAK